MIPYIALANMAMSMIEIINQRNQELNPLHPK